jgi:XRE family transcriptional regulator of biofilm formation
MIGERIKKTREALGISMSQLAEMAGCTRSYLHEVEHAHEYAHQQRIGAVKLYCIAAALGCSMEYLLGMPELPRQGGEIGNDLAVENMKLRRRLARIRGISQGNDE